MVSHPELGSDLPNGSDRETGYYAIPFGVVLVINDAILYNKDAKMNLRHPFLFYGLCKQAGVPLEDNVA